MTVSKITRSFPEGTIPILDISGTARECGQLIGYAWRDNLAFEATSKPRDKGPWWMLKAYQPLIERHAPHLPDFYQGMAQGAGLDENRIGTCATESDIDGCTSFALQAGATLDGHLIAGQTKDTPVHRALQYQVLRMRIHGGPSSLSATYAGWVFGHGFVRNGCAIFRNSLYAGDFNKGLPYGAWGMLALHCNSVHDVAEMVRRYGVRQGFHVTLADHHGNVVGIENTKVGSSILSCRNDIYVHANAVLSTGEAKNYEFRQAMERSGSLYRQQRMYELFLENRTHLTAQMAYGAMMDHKHYPFSICRHIQQKTVPSLTTATIVAEPSKGLLHVTRGPACQNWPQTFAIAQASNE